MGWFDDDDSDEDDKVKKKPQHFFLDPSKPAGQEDDENKEDDEEEEEEDPLDAFMKTLDSTKTKSDEEKKRKQQTMISERLDVENEEEATSHWQHSTTGSSVGQGDAAEDANDAKLAMEATFHKATNGRKQENRQIHIQLETVQHASIGYAAFKKSFLPERNAASGDHWRKEHSIKCDPPLDPIWDFAELRDVFPDAVMEWIVKNGFTKPTLVQSQTLGVALSGKDAIITASTGSGKTLSYLWPLMTHLVENSSFSRALVLVPTRELALQVEKVAKNLSQKLPFSTLAITGGNMGRYQLSQALIKNKPHLIVATPGRLLDVLSAQQKSKQDWLLKEITFLVLDEADKMLQLGFAPQVSQILNSLRPDRQSLLTSATLGQRLERHCHEWMNSPTRISVGRTGRSSQHVDQHVLCLPNREAKETFVQEMLPTFCDVGRTLVFCATRDGCEALGQKLHTIVPLMTLHGDKHPSDRKAALKAFTKGQVKLLVATDVAGRGLDIPRVSTVINFDPAKNWDTHVHRVGRAGRLSTEEQQSGSAYTLLLPSNADFAHVLVQAYTREKREISNDLRVLASQSRQQTGDGSAFSRKAHQNNRSGLGFQDNIDYHGSVPGHYGPPQRKKSRWS